VKRPSRTFRRNPPGSTSAMDWSMAVLKGYISFCKSAEK
jgi:hypothetical protein